MEAEPATLRTTPASAAAVESAGINRLKIYHMANTKKIFTYTKNKDDFMGRENRRYWIINLKTGKKKKITEAQYNDPRI